MRPIRLQLAGLNSFREAQVIDFSVLGETGVFGIFGSTGSGKSSILDAITLALYGTVERAPNHTQGILNQAENQLSVEFTFSLGVGEKRRVFRAERSYKRSGEKTVKAAACRLVEVDKGVDKVHASKSDEMTAKIVEVIGLTVEDFTRAVVLPQGKFAEFLTIKPRDRRLMLERLFALEEYGQNLTNTLNDEIRATDFKLNGVNERFNGLGDASAARVAEAEAELLIANKAVVVRSEQLSILKKTYEEAKQIWAFQEEALEVKGRMEALSCKQPFIEELTARLHLAEQAERLRPLVENVKVAEATLFQVQSKMDEVAGLLNLAVAGKQATEQEWTVAHQDRVGMEPQSQRRIEQLEQAQTLERESRELDGQLAVMRIEYEKLACDQKLAEQKLENLSQQLKIEQVKRELGRLRVAEIKVDPIQRRKVTNAVKGLEAYEIVTSQLEDAQQQLANNQQERQLFDQQAGQAEETVRQVRQKIHEFKQTQLDLQCQAPASDEALGKRLQEVERFRAILVNIERIEREGQQDEVELAKLQGEYIKLEMETGVLNNRHSVLSDRCIEQEKILINKMNVLKESEKNNLAGLLAVGLIEGAPCPVCGSAGHPWPAGQVDDAMLARSTEELELAKIALKNLEVEKSWAAERLAEHRAILNAKKDNVINQTARVDEKRRLLIEHKNHLRQDDLEQTVVELQAKLANEELDLTKERELLGIWKERIDQLNQELDNAQTGLNQALDHSARAQVQKASVDALDQELHKRLENLKREQEVRRQHLDKVREDIGLSEILAIHEKHSRWDQEAVELYQEIAKDDKEIEHFEQLRRQLDEEKRELDLKLRELESIGKEAGRTVSGIKDKITSITNGIPAVELLSCVKEELEAVIRVEAQKKVLYDETTKSLIRAEQEYAILSKEIDLQRIGLQTASYKLEEALAEAPFSSGAEVSEALCDVGQCNELDEIIKKHHQEESLLGQRSMELRGKLGDRRVTEEEWVLWPTRISGAEDEHANCLEQRGAAQNGLNKLRDRHEDWLKLEIERAELSHRYGLLRNLQTVLKGNAFVEYIAEEQLMTVALDASERLGELTNHRYALEVDSEGGFIMRDDANGGTRRPVSSLSGGETFLTSLALALALSVQIQLREESPLEFFFLDEGFGTLDPTLLEVVINTLERLHLQNLTIGIISHVPELKNRLARRLIVIPAEPGGAGSKVKIEMG